MSAAAIQSVADPDSETLPVPRVAYCERVHRLSLDGFNALQIAMMTRRPVIDIRLILAAIERETIKAQKTVRIRRRRRRA